MITVACTKRFAQDRLELSGRMYILVCSDDIDSGIVEAPCRVTFCSYPIPTACHEQVESVDSVGARMRQAMLATWEPLTGLLALNVLQGTPEILWVDGRLNAQWWGAAREFVREYLRGDQAIDDVLFNHKTNEERGSECQQQPAKPQ